MSACTGLHHPASTQHGTWRRPCTSSWLQARPACSPCLHPRLATPRTAGPMRRRGQQSGLRMLRCARALHLRPRGSRLGSLYLLLDARAPVQAQHGHGTCQHWCHHHRHMRAADMQAQHQTWLQAAFQEVLQLAAAVVKPWQPAPDSWQGRQAAYTQLNKWRTEHGARLLFRHFDGDPDDPVNFPTAAAARERPSPLSIYQVLAALPSAGAQLPGAPHRLSC